MIQLNNAVDQNESLIYTRTDKEMAMNRAAQIAVVWILSVGFGSSAYAQGVVTQKNLSLSMARTIAEGALDECKKQGFNTAVAVLDRAGQVHWTANARDAELHLTQNTRGSNIVTSQSFDAATGRLTTILASRAPSTVGRHGVVRAVSWPAKGAITKVPTVMGRVCRPA